MYNGPQFYCNTYAPGEVACDLKICGNGEHRAGGTSWLLATAARCGCEATLLPSCYGSQQHCDVSAVKDIGLSDEAHFLWKAWAQQHYCCC